jgi:hypothetical protein
VGAEARRGMFDIELSLVVDAPEDPEERQGPHSTVILRRDYQEFRALHLGLANLASNGKVGRGITCHIVRRYEATRSSVRGREYRDVIGSSSFSPAHLDGDPQKS